MLAGEIVDGPEAVFDLGEPSGVEVDPLRDAAQGGGRLGHVDRRGLDQAEDLAGARVVARDGFEVAAHIVERPRHRALVIAVEPLHHPAAAVEDRFRVGEPALFGRQRLGFAGAETQPFELVELEAQEIEPGGVVRVERGESGQLAPQLLPPPGRLRHLVEQRVVASKIVQEEPLTIPVEQQVVRVLAVDVDQMPAEFP